MMPIIRVPAQDMATELAVGAQMAMLGRNAGSESSLAARAVAIAAPHYGNGGGVEYGDSPTSDRRGCVYLSWVWDRAGNQFRVVKWDGRGWRPF